MPDLDYELDLDAARAADNEANDRSLNITLGGRRFTLPPALPVDVLGPLMPVLPAVVELLGPLLADAVDEQNGAATFSAAQIRPVLMQLAASPRLPSEVVDAVLSCGRRLFAVQWDDFVATRPTLKEVGLIAGRLSKHYGVGLGELSVSAASSAPAGQTSNETSDASIPASIPVASGADPVPLAS